MEYAVIDNNSKFTGTFMTVVNDVIYDFYKSKGLKIVGIVTRPEPIVINDNTIDWGTWDGIDYTGVSIDEYALDLDYRIATLELGV